MDRQRLHDWVIRYNKHGAGWARRPTAWRAPPEVGEATNAKCRRLARARGGASAGWRYRMWPCSISRI